MIMRRCYRECTWFDVGFFRHRLNTHNTMGQYSLSFIKEEGLMGRNEVEIQFNYIRPRDIYSGIKTAVRQTTRQGAEAGMKMRAVFKSYNIVDLKITAVYNQRLGDVSDDDARKEGYESLDQFKEAWNLRHPWQGWNPEQDIWVIEWKKPG